MSRFVQCCLNRGITATLLLCLPLCVAAAPAVAAGPSLPAVGVDIAPVDVVGNVRRMLEQARLRQQRSPAAPPATAPQPSIAPAASAAPPAPAASSAPTASAPAAAPPVTAAEPASGPPVQLPDKVITIRDIKDLRGLAEELEKAKRRQQGAQP